mmetsp:Transcript_22389/g.67346  ORF Transcript_22389/g.67346 Transcript_22389/m.67346 type:complete len:114 (+) Transcript_22389:983-1324(+)
MWVRQAVELRFNAAVCQRTLSLEFWNVDGKIPGNNRTAKGSANSANGMITNSENGTSRVKSDSVRTNYGRTGGAAGLGRDVRACSAKQCSALCKDGAAPGSRQHGGPAAARAG